MDCGVSNVLTLGPIYHVAPLHYLPEILAAGELRSQRILGIDMGRFSARRRDRMLNVDRYVHLSLAPITPLLVDKLRLGYPHVILEFDIDQAVEINVSALQNNTKAWRSRWQCGAVADPHDIHRMVRLSRCGNRFPSLEILIEDKLPTTYLTKTLVITEDECQMVAALGETLRLDVRIALLRGLSMPDYAPQKIDIIRRYYKEFGKYGASNRPKLPFD